MRRLRILGLHGYHGSGPTLRVQAAPLVDSLAALADVVYVDAPALAAGDFGWWHARDAGDGVRYRGWTRTRDWLAGICAAARDAGTPFEGVLGFSQGAALAGALVALAAHDAGAAPRFDFAILAGGFVSRDARHAPAFAVPGGIAVPSLHIIGRSDGVIAPAASHALAAAFRRPVIAEHAGGHVVAGTPVVRAAAHDFLFAQLQRSALRRAG